GRHARGGGPNQAALSPPTKENGPGALRRAGAAGSAGWPSLNARLSPESPVSRPHVLRQALPAVPARRRPPRRLSVGRLKACCLASVLALHFADVRHVADEVAVARVDRKLLPVPAEAVFASAGSVEGHVRVADVAKDRRFRFHTSK